MGMEESPPCTVVVTGLPFRKVATTYSPFRKVGTAVDITIPIPYRHGCEIPPLTLSGSYYRDNP